MDQGPDENELLLLGLLGERDRHGYELHEFLNDQLRFVSGMPRATAYRVLDRLRKDGLIEGELGERSGKPARRTYTLTKRGKSRLDALLREELRRPDRPIAPARAALLFIGRLPPAEATELLERRVAALSERRDELERSLALHPAEVPGRLILEHDVALLDAELAFMMRLLARTKARRQTKRR